MIWSGMGGISFSQACVDDVVGVVGAECVACESGDEEREKERDVESIFALERM